MWAGTLDDEALRRTESNMRTNQLHRDDLQFGGDDLATDRHLDTVRSPTDSPEAEAGTWGERDAGAVDSQDAIEEYEALRTNLSQLHKTRTRDTQASKATGRSRRGRSLSRVRTKRTQDDAGGCTDKDVEAGLDGTKDEDEFELGQFMREGHFEPHTEDGPTKKVGVIYKSLTVKGVGNTTAYVHTLPDAIIGTFGPDLYRIVCRFLPFLKIGRPLVRTILHDFTGCVRDGEMILVLGRPGSGCSTFLKAVSNNRESFAAVEGVVSYGGIPAEKQKRMYRGEVNYNGEDDIHFASLNVWQTLTFALGLKSKKKEADDIPVIASALMKIFGISHTKYTLVGDEYIRGVSGGERKRVSIAETLASKSTVQAWDNSTRGLDASTALDYAKSLRVMTDISNRTTLVSLYQAGEGIYELFDKVLVIDQGRQIFSGPVEDAKQYFIDIGFECPDRQTTADFLTAVTDANERRFRPGFEDKAPKTPEEFEKAFRSSANYQKLLADVEEYENHLQQTDYEDARRFEGAVQQRKSKNVPKTSSYTVSFPRQVWLCTERELWLLLGDKTTLWTKLFIVISNGLIVGSLFYGQASNTEGIFSRSGATFFSIVFLGWLQLSELMKAVSGRVVLARQRDYAFYRPSAVAIARILLDFPVIAIQVAIFGITMYFMTDLQVDAGKFWIYMLFVYVTTIVLTAMYRMFASVSPDIDTAVRFSGTALNLLVIYVGYVIPKKQLLSEYIWFGWLYWVNPISYSFEGVVSNEFSGRQMPCAPSEIVPQGPGVRAPFQGCALGIVGFNSTTISGDDFLNASYNYSRGNLWRNFGVIIAFAVLYVLVTFLAMETLNFSKSGGGALIFKKTRKSKKQVERAGVNDTEKSAQDEPLANRLGESPSTNPEEEQALGQLSKSESIFTWKDVEYTVPYLGGQRKLLNKVSGYAKPGVMVALMGASGAGKTTLLNTLAQRQTVGVIQGEMLVDGRPLGKEFQRNTGFCLQGDLHDGTQTVREAIEFSAILRQEASIPRSEKIAYVDNIIDLLELHDLQDAIIMSLGVEQRKRLTIGVELAAKPSLLLFLDEPTSGLDSQSAYSIIRFLKKLSKAGQAIVCTIHQPSSVLIQQFDMVLALNPGGNTFYFGPIGENGKDVIEYFAQRGAHCPPQKNVAEFILETAARPHKNPDGTKVDWNEEWRNSEQAMQVLEEIDGLQRTRSHVSHGPVPKEEQREFAASSWVQTVELTKRMFVQHWRDPSYLYGKFFVAVLIGLFNGFTFWKLGHSIQDMQNRMFTCFLIVTVPPTVVNAVVPKFYTNMALWQAREYPARIYGWFAFCTANIVAEIPAAIVAGFLYWVFWLWPTGLSTQSPVSGYTFLMTILIFLFMNSWGQWICAFAPSFTVISNVLPFFFVMFGLFNGVVRPYSELPVFWRYWMYYVNPSRYWMSGMLSATLSGVPVQCSSDEAVPFSIPPGQTCQDYAGSFAQSSGGYLLDPLATGSCQYCPYTSADQYLQTLNINPDERWRDFGIFLAFCFSNWALVYFFIYAVRVRKWSFGFGYLTRGMGKVMKAVSGPVSRGTKKN